MPPEIQRTVGLAGAPSSDLHRFSHEAMATIYEVYAVHPDAHYAAQAAHAAFALVDQLERELSRFIPNSDVSRINLLAAGERVTVGASAMECLLIAQHVHALTGGAFDASIGTGLLTLDLVPYEGTVHSPAGGVRLDLGAIGKGYAVDRVAVLLEEWGIRQALVHGGFSSVLALDPAPGRDGWPLTLSDPATPSRVLVRMDARQLAFAASGVRKKDHIVDPRTGTPVRGRLAAWAALPRPVSAGSGDPLDGPLLAAGAVTDAVTTAFMLLDAAEVEALCARNPGLEAWLLSEPNPETGEEPVLEHFGGRD